MNEPDKDPNAPISKWDTYSDFEKGVISMARNTKAGVKLLRNDKWDIDMLDNWLDLVIENKFKANQLPWNRFREIHENRLVSSG